MTTFFFYIPLPHSTLPPKTPFPHNRQYKKTLQSYISNVNPVGKPETVSWENLISLLEKNIFPVEKLFFSSWALSAPLSDAFLFLFDLLWLLSVNTKKVLRFHLCYDTRNILEGDEF